MFVKSQLGVLVEVTPQRNEFSNRLSVESFQSRVPSGRRGAAQAVTCFGAAQLMN
jgi:hypothetical protein